MEDKISLAFQNLRLNIPFRLKRGKGDSIIFIHGLGASKECFKDAWDFSSDTDCSILTYDLPGFGNCDKPPEYSYSMEDQAEVSRLLINKLNLNRVHIVGHSMGGAIGLLLAGKIKPRARSFICLEGNLIGEDCSGSRKAAGYSLDAFLNGGFEDFKSEISRNEDRAESPGYGLESFLDSLSRCAPCAFYRSSQSLVKWSDSGKLLKLFLGLDIPKYYVFGSDNQDSPVIKLLAGITKIKISNAGHAMMTDNLGEFYQALFSIIKKIGSA